MESTDLVFTLVLQQSIQHSYTEIFCKVLSRWCFFCLNDFFRSPESSLHSIACTHSSKPIFLGNQLLFLLKFPIRLHSGLSLLLSILLTLMITLKLWSPLVLLFSTSSPPPKSHSHFKIQLKHYISVYAFWIPT